MATAPHIELSITERHQLLSEWNNTKREYPKDQCLHHLFEAQVRNAPNAIAVAFEDRRLSYRELNFLGNKVAHDLQNLGVGPDALVGLCVERSPEMFVGILAILKAGGAYVPLDPTYPDERLSTIMSEAQPRVLLTQRQFISRFAEHDGPVIFLDDNLTFEAGGETDNLGIEMTPENLAYVIFTSGSTGKPKGVLISHRSLVNHSTAMARYYDLQPCDRVLQFASFSFDVAAEEIFPTWLRGGAVVPWREGSGVPSVKSFIGFIEQREITVVNPPAPYWHEWVYQLEEVGVPPKLRLVVVGSEKVSAEKFSIWKNQIGDRVRLCNAYGPTEATVTATVYEPSGTFQGNPTDCVPIGRPIDNTEAYVLDQHLNLVPIGVPGELYIGGDGLARGYLNRPELTAERFIAHPFCAETGARIYKTGDLARYSSDGNLEYLGRIDNQVKLRGFRIELGEIEAVINQHAGVQDTTMIVREDTPGDKRLVAYVVQARQGAFSIGDLRNYLEQKLPEYMVPSAFVALDSFPLTPSGKVDRRALPAPDLSSRGADKYFIAPRNPIECQLANLWSGLLSVRPVGIHDNFFDLGGNSLLALRLVRQIEKTFGKDIPVGAVFQAPTVEELATLVIQDGPSISWSSLVPLQPSGSKPLFFWIHGEVSDAFLPRYLGRDQPVYGLRHQSEDGQPARYTTVEEIAAHHLSEIRTVQPAGPYFLGGYCFGGMVAFEIAQKLEKQNEEVPLLVLLAPDIPKNFQPVSLATKVNGLSNNGRSFGNNLHRYVRTLKALEPRQKLAYVVAGTTGKIKEKLLFPARKFGMKIIQKAACRLYFGLGYPLPIALRSRYILDLYDQAASEYVPDIYAGRIVVFKPAEEYINLQPWQRVAVNGLEVHEVPGTHTDVVYKETHVRVWAEQLRSRLESARSAVSKYDSGDILFAPHEPKHANYKMINNPIFLGGKLRS